MSPLTGESLTLGFVQSRPHSAAEVLGELDYGATARFLESIPARIAAPAFALMHADDAAAALARMEPSRGAALIRAMTYPDALTVLRLLPAASRAALCQELPRRLAEEVGKSLLYPGDVVGAWMEPSIPVFPLTSTVADVMRYLRRHLQVQLDHVFVVDEAQRLSGTVSVGVLLGAEPSSNLQALQRVGLKPLSNRARVLVVAADPAWDDHSVLPVAGRKGNLLGGLSRAQLRRGLHALEEEQRVHAGSVESTSARIVSALLVSAAGLLRAGSAGVRRHD